jgi:hypothetical protein
MPGLYLKLYLLRVPRVFITMFFSTQQFHASHDFFPPCHVETLPTPLFAHGMICHRIFQLGSLQLKTLHLALKAVLVRVFLGPTNHDAYNG